MRAKIKQPQCVKRRALSREATATEASVLRGARSCNGATIGGVAAGCATRYAPSAVRSRGREPYRVEDTNLGSRGGFISGAPGNRRFFAPSGTPMIRYWKVAFDRPCMFSRT